MKLYALLAMPFMVVMVEVFIDMGIKFNFG